MRCQAREPLVDWIDRVLAFNSIQYWSLVEWLASLGQLSLRLRPRSRPGYRVGMQTALLYWIRINGMITFVYYYAGDPLMYWLILIFIKSNDRSKPACHNIDAVGVTSISALYTSKPNPASVSNTSCANMPLPSKIGGIASSFSSVLLQFSSKLLDAAEQRSIRVVTVPTTLVQ